MKRSVRLKICAVIVWVCCPDLQAATIPQVATSDADRVTETSAYLNAEIIDDGGDMCSGRWRYRIKDCRWNVIDWSPPRYAVFYVQHLNGILYPGTEYEFSFQASNSAGSSDWTPPRSFKTPGTQPVLYAPEVETHRYTSVRADRASVSGSILNDRGQDCETRFVYWKEGGPEMATEWTCCSRTDDIFEVQIVGLDTWTTYSYRAEARTYFGAAKGNVKTFQTWGNPYNISEGNPLFFYEITTDKDLYVVGETVHWSIYAGVSGADVAGIAGFDISLYESMNESMEAPYSEFIWHIGSSRFYTNYVKESYFTTGMGLHSFNIHENFSASEGSAGGGGVRGIGVSQFEKKTGMFGGKLCEGTYELTKTGFHALFVSHDSGYYWIEDQDDAVESGRNTGGITAFIVSHMPWAFTVGQIDTINSHMGQTGCSETNNWCDNSDFNGDGNVDLLDVSAFFYEVRSFPDVSYSIDLVGDRYVYQDMVVPGESMQPENLIVLGPRVDEFKIRSDNLVFNADELVAGEDLWQVELDTSEPNEFDMYPNLEGENPQIFTRVGDELYYVDICRVVEHTDLTVYCDRFNTYFGIYKLPANAEQPVLVKEDIVSVSHSWSKYTSDLSWMRCQMFSFQGNLYYLDSHERIRNDEDYRGLQSIWRLDTQTYNSTLMGTIDFWEYLHFYKYYITDNHIYIPLQKSNGPLTLWACDGTSLTFLKEIPNARHMTETGRYLFFTLDNSLWVSDGTVEGTREILSNVVIAADKDDTPLVTIDNTVYFSAFDEQGGAELWKSDGTVEGTMRMVDLVPGSGSALPLNLKSINDTLYFTTIPEQNETLLWQSDGTEEGTRNIASLSGESNAPKLHQFSELAGRLYFLLDDKLWMHYAQTTEQLEETASLSVQQLMLINDKLVLVVDAAQDAQAIWIFNPEP